MGGVARDEDERMEVPAADPEFASDEDMENDAAQGYFDALRSALGDDGAEGGADDVHAGEDCQESHDDEATEPPSPHSPDRDALDPDHISAEAQRHVEQAVDMVLQEMSLDRPPGSWDDAEELKRPPGNFGIEIPETSEKTATSSVSSPVLIPLQSAPPVLIPIEPSSGAQPSQLSTPEKAAELAKTAEEQSSAIEKLNEAVAALEKGMSEALLQSSSAQVTVSVLSPTSSQTVVDAQSSNTAPLEEAVDIREGFVLSCVEAAPLLDTATSEEYEEEVMPGQTVVVVGQSREADGSTVVPVRLRDSAADRLPRWVQLEYFQVLGSDGAIRAPAATVGATVQQNEDERMEVDANAEVDEQQTRHSAEVDVRGDFKTLIREQVLSQLEGNSALLGWPTVRRSLTLRADPRYQAVGSDIVRGQIYAEAAKEWACQHQAASTLSATTAEASPTACGQSAAMAPLAADTHEVQTLDDTQCAKIKGSYARPVTECIDMRHVHCVEQTYGFELSVLEVGRFFPNLNQVGQGRITYDEYFQMMKEMVLSRRLDWNYDSKFGSPAKRPGSSFVPLSAVEVFPFSPPVPARELATEDVAAESLPAAHTVAEEVSAPAVTPERSRHEESSPRSVIAEDEVVDDVVAEPAALEEADETELAPEPDETAVAIFGILTERLRPRSVTWDGVDIVVDEKVWIKEPYSTVACSAGPAADDQALLKQVQNRLAFIRATMRLTTTPKKQRTPLKASAKSAAGKSTAPPPVSSGPQLWDDDAEDEEFAVDPPEPSFDEHGEYLGTVVEVPEEEMEEEEKDEAENGILAHGLDEETVQVYAELASERTRDEEVVPTPPPHPPPLNLLFGAHGDMHMEDVSSSGTFELREDDLLADPLFAAADAWKPNRAAELEDHGSSTALKALGSGAGLGARPKQAPSTRPAMIEELVDPGLGHQHSFASNSSVALADKPADQLSVTPDDAASSLFELSARYVSAATAKSAALPVTASGAQAKSAGLLPAPAGVAMTNSAGQTTDSGLEGSLYAAVSKSAAVQASSAEGLAAASKSSMPKAPGMADPATAFNKPMQMLHPPPRGDQVTNIVPPAPPAPPLAEAAPAGSHPKQMPVHAAPNTFMQQGAMNATGAAGALPRRIQITDEMIRMHKQMIEQMNHHKTCLNEYARRLSSFYSAHHCSMEDFPAMPQVPLEPVLFSWAAWQQPAYPWQQQPYSGFAQAAQTMGNWMVVQEQQHTWQKAASMGASGQLHQQASPYAAAGVGPWRLQIQQAQAQAVQLRQALQMQQAQASQTQPQISQQQDAVPAALPAPAADEAPAPPPPESPPPPPPQTPPPPESPRPSQIQESESAAEEPPPPPPEPDVQASRLMEVLQASDVSPIFGSDGPPSPKKLKEGNTVIQVNARDASCAASLLEAFGSFDTAPAGDAARARAEIKDTARARAEIKDAASPRAENKDAARARAASKEEPPWKRRRSTRIAAGMEGSAPPWKAPTPTKLAAAATGQSDSASTSASGPVAAATSGTPATAIAAAPSSPPVAVEACSPPVAASQASTPKAEAPPAAAPKLPAATAPEAVPEKALPAARPVAEKAPPAARQDHRPTGLVTTKTLCSRCKFLMPSKGGIFCGRVKDGEYFGCGSPLCWRCLKRAPNVELGTIRTTKSECEQLGADAWWMHEKCMSAEDERDYCAALQPQEEGDPAVDPPVAGSDAIPNGSDAVDQEGIDGSDDNRGQRFAWE